MGDDICFVSMADKGVNIYPLTLRWAKNRFWNSAKVCVCGMKGEILMQCFSIIFPFRNASFILSILCIFNANLTFFIFLFLKADVIENTER